MTHTNKRTRRCPPRPSWGNTEPTRPGPLATACPPRGVAQCRCLGEAGQLLQLEDRQTGASAPSGPSPAGSIPQTARTRVHTKARGIVHTERPAAGEQVHACVPARRDRPATRKEVWPPAQTRVHPGNGTPRERSQTWKTTRCVTRPRSAPDGRIYRQRSWGWRWDEGHERGVSS